MPRAAPMCGNKRLSNQSALLGGGPWHPAKSITCSILACTPGAWLHDFRRIRRAKAPCPNHAGRHNQLALIVLGLKFPNANAERSQTHFSEMGCTNFPVDKVPSLRPLNPNGSEWRLGSLGAFLGAAWVFFGVPADRTIHRILPFA